MDTKIGLKEMKICSPDKLILGHVNVNLIRKKINSLVYMPGKIVDIFLISETKLDNSFTPAQFKIEGFTTPYSYVRDDKGGGLLLCIREEIPSSLMQCKTQWNIKCLSIEINLRK